MSSDDAQQQPLLGEPRRVLEGFTSQGFWHWNEVDPSSELERSRFQMRRFLTSRAGHYSILALVILDVSCIFADFVITIFQCERRDPHPGWTTTLDALGIVSLVFSCLFMAELLCSIWAFGFAYFKSKFHVFDAVVIVAGFVIDVLLRGPVEEVASLVVVLRLWRVVKIIEELSVGAEEQMENLQERISVLEEQNRELKREVEELKLGR